MEESCTRLILPHAFTLTASSVLKRSQSSSSLMEWVYQYSLSGTLLKKKFLTRKEIPYRTDTALNISSVAAEKMTMTSNSFQGAADAHHSAWPRWLGDFAGRERPCNGRELRTRGRWARDPGR